MGIRSKFFIIIIPLLSVAVFFVNSVAADRFLKQFLTIESSLAHQNIDRALDAIDADLDNLSAKLSDWSQWDDTYHFMQDHNESYWQSNLSNGDILVKMEVDAMAFVDASGKLVASRSILNQQNTTDILAQDLLDKVLTNEFLKFNDGVILHKGILHADGKVFLVASRPILKTDASGPSLGTLLFIRVVDDDFVSGISNRIHLPLQIYTTLDVTPLDSQQKNILLQEGLEGSDDVENIESGMIVGYGQIHNMVGDDKLFACIKMSRDIYMQGKLVISFLTFFIVAMSIVAILLLAVLLEWIIFRPISRLSVEMNRLQLSGDDSLRINIVGSDQFARLGIVINEMLNGLSSLQQKNKESEHRFKTIADVAPVLIWIADVNKKCTYFNKGWLDFTGRTLNQEQGDGWVEGVHPDDLNRCMQIYSKAFDAREAFRMEYRLKHQSGQYKWILDTGVPNISQDETFLGYLGSCIDITDRKNSEEQLTIKFHELEVLNKMMVSRELKMIELKEELRKLKG